MKVSEVTVVDVAKYLRLDEIDEDELQPILSAARAFLRSETGLTDTEIDEHDDFYIAVLVLCQDMHDNRSVYVEKDHTNQVVDAILGMHRVNLL